MTPVHTFFFFLFMVPTGFLYSFYSLLAPLFGCFQLIFLLTHWFFCLFLSLGQVCWWIPVEFFSLLIVLCMLSHLSHVWLFVTLWTVAHQAPLSTGFSRQAYWSGLPCTPPGDLPDPGIKPESLTLPALADRFFTTSATWEAHSFIIQLQNI